jgi:endonuclease YncB( thermonuclease family)
MFGAMAVRADEQACQPSPIGTATVRAAVDGRSLTLADGRTLRLSGLERSSSDDHARSALNNAVVGREVALFRSGPDADRYGRLLAWVVVAPPQAAISVQEILLAQGHARVAAKTGDFACAARLWRAERPARDGGLGVWADPHYVIRNAEDSAGILAVRGEFAVVEGRVLSVRESGGTIYVNFGNRWSDDFTVTVPKRNERIFSASGLDLRKLAGRNVRIRGTVEERAGPWIEATRPEQIEIAERP